MARRITREQTVRPRRRVGVFSLAALTILLAAGWMAPAVLVHTSLRDRPLEEALAHIDGTIQSRSARWTWLKGIEYRDIVLTDRAGQAAVSVPSLVIEKGLLGLALDPKSLGTVRLSGLEAIIAVRPGASSLEDILAPWLAAANASSGVACDLELVDGTVELIDTLRGDAWRVSDLFAACTLSQDGLLAGWTAAGRVRHAGRPQAGLVDRAAAPRPASEPPPQRLDRMTIPAAAAAALSREGGWSIAAPAPVADSARSVAITTHRLPLGISSVVATRFGGEHVADGLADIRLDITRAKATSEIQGRAVIEQLAICSASTLAEEFVVPGCELPLDLRIDDGGITVRELRIISPVVEAEISGRLPPFSADPWQWLEDAVASDCAAAARIDLAAAADALSGGLVVRDDVSVTAGTLQLSAVARADGADRLLEVRLDARDLAAIRQVAAIGGEADEDGGAQSRPAGERLLRWNEPFSAWLRGRRGPGREAGLRIEEARLASQAAEISATGTPANLHVQWTIDLGGLVGELAEVLDLGGVTLAGKSRGRLDAERAGGGVTAVTLAASINNFELGQPDLPAWKDDSIALDAELIGSLSGSLASIDRARGHVTAAGDSLDISLAGGVLLETAAVTGMADQPAAVWIRPAAAGGEVSADCSLVGDLGRWQRRLAAVSPSSAIAGLELGGNIEATAAVAPAAPAGSDAWRITKATGQIERFVMHLGDRQAAEPRIVATAAGLVRPTTGEIEISSAEVLSSSLSLRSGGVAWLAGGNPVQAAGDGPLETLMQRVRGRVQWQADLSRLVDWIVPHEVVAAWPLAGRAWGTFDVAETQLGVNLLAEATGSQVAIARRVGGKGEPESVWAEPQASLVLEVTRPFARSAEGRLTGADRLVIDRLAFESSTLAVAARGIISDWSTRCQTELTGSLSYDWAQLSRLATPWTGGRIRLAGAVNRPFTVRGPLGGFAPDAVASADALQSPPAPGTLPLPESWLAATRGGDEAGRGEVAVPVIAAATPGRFGERLAGVSLETSAAWTAADIDGFPVSGGELAIRLVEGQVAFGPFDVAASGGRLRGSPWLTFRPAPGELVVPPGRIIDRVQLTGGLSDRFVSWISPLLGKSIHTSGLVSIDTAGARLPLGDLLGGDMTAQVLFEQFEVQPSGAMQPLVNLLGKLQAVIDPRFAVSDTAVLLRVRPEPIRVRLANRRIWHEGLVMDSGQFTVTSKGSVGTDGSLAMLVEVALRGDLLGQTPVVATLLRTPIAIPLKGTLERPQFDAGAIDVTVKRILENTARGVIDDGIGRGLETLFGKPPPAPLMLPR